ncbi:MAG: hypothetical protein KUL75_00965 [Sterolibacterium sp.]|nr:hypothetical protein [Sterolibacterium sp.]
MPIATIAAIATIATIAPIALQQQIDNQTENGKQKQLGHGAKDKMNVEKTKGMASSNDLDKPPVRQPPATGTPLSLSASSPSPAARLRTVSCTT